MAGTQDYKGKWALVTGASAGIGMALARELARTEPTSSLRRGAETGLRLWPRNSPPRAPRSALWLRT